jgi:nucleoside-diphosphate-sugar epimerase
MSTTAITEEETNKCPALVFGASGIQGKAVLQGFVESDGYSPVYGVSRRQHPNDGKNEDDMSESHHREHDGVTFLVGDFGSTEDVERILQQTKAQAIFVVSTTDLGNTAGFHVAMEDEYQTILNFFDTLIKVYKEDGLKRHVVLSTYDNVQRVCQDVYDLTGKTWIEPLDDGSIVPHYSGKGRAAEQAMELLEGIEGLSLTLLTLPFLHSNFLGFFTPLPNRGETQWTISACFGDSNKHIDMLSASDLRYIVRTYTVYYIILYYIL